ncbi:MAG TPA: toll/interleukin-1 receptor domain-containing protein [Rhodocyclaceae bacterium]|jgi:hypothetical protein|nr:toll/interleukin-1 receptor domain-containing protein [Rhodocyclaceae bacterium]
MSDIFLSYASADREQAKQCVCLLEQHGWSVWWDRSIPAGRTFDRVIEEQLAHARCVVVLWSHASAESDWVRTEAADGLRRKILVPAMIGMVEIPLEFRRVQAADLSNWKGNPDSSGFRFLCESIATCLGSKPPRTSPPQPARSRTIPKVALGALAGVLVVAATIGLITYVAPPDDPHTAASYTIGENSKGCEPFEDPVEAVGRGPVTRLAVIHGDRTRSPRPEHFAARASCRSPHSRNFLVLSSGLKPMPVSMSRLYADFNRCRHLNTPSRDS